MSAVQVIALIVRLFAIGLVAYTVRDLTWVFSAEEVIITRLYIVWTTLFLAVAFILWRFPLMIASRIVRPDLESQDTQSWSMEELYCCGIVLTGFVFLLWTISDAMYWLAVGIAYSREPDLSLLIEQKAAILATAAELALAFSLIFGANGWRRLIYRIRYGKEV